MTPRQVSWFSDFVRILYDLNTLFPQRPRHVTSTRCSTFHVSSWIRPQHTPNIMNIIFWITKFHYFMHLQFKFEVYKKNSTKQKKLTKYTKKSQNCPKFEQGVLNNVRRPHKKNEAKKQKKNSSPSAFPGTRQRGPLPSAMTWHSGKPTSLPSARVRHSAKQFFSFNGVGGWAVK